MERQMTELSLEELWELFPIFLTRHSEEWKGWYEEEARCLEGMLPMDRIRRLEHVGSTSVETIWAKPIIDILVEMEPGEDMGAVRTILEQNGYVCMSEKEDRLSFNKGYTPKGFAERVYHLHLRQDGDNDELYFRDYLRDYPDVAKDYEALKLGLWKQYEHDRDAYTDSKGEFVRKYTRKAKSLYGERYGKSGRGKSGYGKSRCGKWRRAAAGDADILRRIARESEAHWGFDEAFMDTFDRKFNITREFIEEHPVFVFLKDEAPAAFWGVVTEGDGCGLEYFYIAEAYLGKGYGRQMWEHLTCWCGEHGIREMHFVTSWEAAGFYEKMGAQRDGEAVSVIDGRKIPRFCCCL